MNPVSILIFNSLAMREAVSLPGVGTLMVTFVGAAKAGSGRIVPPHNRIEFLKEIYRGRDVVEMIALSSGKDIEVSEKIYRKWLDESTVDGVLTIEGVGTIFNRRFTPDKMIARVVNPAGADAVRLKKRDGGVKVFVISAALIAAAALSFAAVAFWDAPQGRWLREKAESILEKDEKPLSEVEKDIEMPVEESAAGPFGDSSGEFAVDPELKPAAEPLADPDMSSQQPEQQPHKQPSQQPSQRPEQSQPAEVSGPFYYVIIGNFSVDENAERFIIQCKARDNKLNYGKLTLDNGKVMVYTSRSSSPTEARDLRKLESYPEAWVFKYRN